MPQPKRRRFEIRQRQKRRRKRVVVKRAELGAFTHRVRQLLRSSKRDFTKRPIEVLFVCEQGIANSPLMREGFLKFLKQQGLQNIFSTSFGRVTFSDVFPVKNRFEYIVVANRRVHPDEVKKNLERVDPNSKAKILDLPLEPGTDYFDEKPYRNLALLILENEAATTKH